MENHKEQNILLCDDNMLNRKLIIAMLNGQPYRVIEATNGREALDCALTDNHSIDLVLLDISMKGLSGVEVCRAIRDGERHKRHHLPIIAYTAHAMIDERERYISAGFDDILTKPVMREELFRILSRYLPE